jgi:amino acid adenylation domain-containing protein
VVIAVRRSIDSVVALLGIARAGAHYVPLDASYPRERLELMLRDSAARMVLTQSDLLPVLPHVPITYECLDRPLTQGVGDAAARPHNTATPEDLAYLIYTSGSTGTPKAVMLDHRGRVNNFTDFNRRFDIGPGDRLLALASLGFDMSAYDVFGTLAAGAAIVLPDSSDEREPSRWAELIRRHHVTVWHSVPALLQMLVERVSSEKGGTLESLRLVLLGGDWIPVTLPERLAAIAPNARVVSLGGATEVSMDSTFFAIDRIDPTWESIPYGRPMANQTAYVVDRRGNLVPVGVPGELCLGGVGVGWGYYNRPDLTAEKFIPDAFCGRPGARLYRTGDLARFMPDGNLQLLGRIDHQIKIRGVRIEPGEISARLRQHPLVDDAVVMAREDIPGDRRLVAYLLAKPEIDGLTAELRAFVREALPEYMVPSAFIRLDRLPLTSNGKLDRRALPAPGRTVSDTHAATQPPTTPLQHAIAIVWTQVLDVSAIDVNQSFFDVGGHSLLVAQVASRLQEIFQVEVPMRAMFLSPTIADLSQTLERLGSDRGVNVARIAEIFVQVHAMSDADAKTALDHMRRTEEGAAS